VFAQLLAIAVLIVASKRFGIRRVATAGVAMGAELRCRVAGGGCGARGRWCAGMRDGDVTTARFSDPFGIASASNGGTVYVADAGDAQRIRRIASDGSVSTLAGGEPGFADGRGAAAQLQYAVRCRRCRRR
jgi:hypothetical protein